MADAPKLFLQDLLVLKTQAGREYTQMPAWHLNDAPKPLPPAERIALGWLRSSLMVLNSKGAFRPGFLEEFQQALNLPDSDPEADYADWTEVADPKARKP